MAGWIDPSCYSGNFSLQSQQQVQRQRTIEASKQMVFDVYSSIIALLEELETRELARDDKERLEKSDISIPNQTKKMDEDVETIIQIEILALKYQLKCFDSGNRKAVRQYLRDVTRHWMIPREGQNLKSEIYVNSLFEVLYNRAYTLDNAKMEKCDSFSDEDLQGLLIANDQCHRLDEAFEKDPTRKASLPNIRQTRQDKSEYLETETSVDPAYPSMDVQRQNFEDDGFNNSIRHRQSQDQQDTNVHTHKPDQRPYPKCTSTKTHENRFDDDSLNHHNPHEKAKVHQLKKIHTLTSDQQVLSEMSQKGSKNVPLFVRCCTDNMDNIKIFEIWCTSEKESYKFDLQMMKVQHEHLRNTFHLKSSPLKVFIGDISNISQKLFDGYKVVLDGTEVDSFNFALESLSEAREWKKDQLESAFKLIQKENISYDELYQLHTSLICSALQKPKERKIYKQRLFETINSEIHPDKLQKITSKRKKETEREKKSVKKR